MAYTDNFKASTGPSAASNDDDDRKIFVGGLSWNTTKENLQDYFATFGTIVDCVLKVDLASGRSRGFGFVLFDQVATVDKVMRQSHILDGRNIVPQKARKGLSNKAGGGGEPVLKIFVGGVDPDVPEKTIWEHFGAYGKVVDLDLPYDRTKQCRRAFCFVTFESETAVNAVCADQKQQLGDKFVDVKRATPKPKNDSYGAGGYGGAGGGYGAGGYGGGGYAGAGGYGGAGGYQQATAYGVGAYGAGGYGTSAAYGTAPAYGNGAGTYSNGAGGYGGGRGAGRGGYQQSSYGQSYGGGQGGYGGGGYGGY